MYMYVKINTVHARAVSLIFVMLGPKGIPFRKKCRITILIVCESDTKNVSTISEQIRILNTYQSW